MQWVLHCTVQYTVSVVVLTCSTTITNWTITRFMCGIVLITQTVLCPAWLKIWLKNEEGQWWTGGG